MGLPIASLRGEPSGSCVAEFDWYKTDIERQRTSGRPTTGGVAESLVVGCAKPVLNLIGLVLFIICAIAAFRFFTTFGQPSCEGEVSYSRIPVFDQETGEVTGFDVQEHLPLCAD